MKREIVRLNKIAFRVAAILFFAVVFFLLVSTNMRKGLSHDEHMYVAAGELLARDGLLPYRDYPYLQMPNLVLVYGALFQVSGHLLLTARLLNTQFAALLLGALFYYATSLLPEAGVAVRLFAGVGTVLLVMANPLFIYTSGLAWNHDLPILLVVLAAVLYLRTGPAGQSARRCLLYGLLVGFAAGTRLSFLLAIIPFAAGLLVIPHSAWQKKLNLFGAFLLGGVLGLIPSILLTALAPAQSLFGNWTYHQVNQAYWQQQGYERAMDMLGKLAYLKDVAVEPGNLILLAAFVLSVLINKKLGGDLAHERSEPASWRFRNIMALIAAFLIGSLVPTPSWYQYYYVLVPFLVLGIAYHFACIYKVETHRKWGMVFFGLAIVASGIYALTAYLRLNNSISPEGWVPIQTHRVGDEIRQALGASKGKVATLAPIFPLEGGLAIYRELATGPFVWRVAPLLRDEQRKQPGAISGDDIERLLNADPPAGILTGFEGGLEGPLMEYANRRGYRQLRLSNGATLWLPVVVNGKMSP